MEFATFNQIFSIFFAFLGLCPRPHRGLCPCMDPAVDGTYTFVLLQNKFLATPLLTVLPVPDHLAGFMGSYL